jgi:hypothetical protein
MSTPKSNRKQKRQRRSARPRCSGFRAGTGLMGATESGQRVTASNLAQLPPGSVVRNGDGSRVIHLHDEVWLYCSDCAHCYDRVEFVGRFLDARATLCHIPNNQGERREAAAADVRFASELNGCLPFAPPCGFGLPWPQGSTFSSRVKNLQMLSSCPLASHLPNRRKPTPMCSLRSLTCLQVQVLPRQGMVGPSSDSRPWPGETLAGASSAVNGRACRRRRAVGGDWPAALANVQAATLRENCRPEMGSFSEANEEGNSEPPNHDRNGEGSHDRGISHQANWVSRRGRGSGMYGQYDKAKKGR